jgi:hypothetical protein
MFNKSGTFDREDSSSPSKIFSKSKISLSDPKSSVFENLSSRGVLSGLVDKIIVYNSAFTFI